MKDLITSIAAVFILSIFIFQFSANQVTHSRIMRADMAIDNFRDTAKEEGCISSSNRDNLTEQLARICGCDRDEVQVSGDSSRKERGEIIYYHISYPLSGLVAASSALGISSGENMAYIEDSNWVVSRFEDRSTAEPGPDESGPEEAGDDGGYGPDESGPETEDGEK